MSTSGMSSSSSTSCSNTSCQSCSSTSCFTTSCQSCSASWRPSVHSRRGDQLCSHAASEQRAKSQDVELSPTSLTLPTPAEVAEETEDETSSHDPWLQVSFHKSDLPEEGLSAGQQDHNSSSKFQIQLHILKVIMDPFAEWQKRGRLSSPSSPPINFV